MAKTEDQSQQEVIIVEDETLRNGFTQIPNAILRREDLSPGAKLTYMGLLSYAWQKGSCFPGQEKLAEDLGISRRSVVTYLQQLQQAKLLSIKRRGLGQTNIYFLPKITNLDTTQSRSANSALLDVSFFSLLEAENLHPKNTQIKNTQKEEYNSKFRKASPKNSKKRGGGSKQGSTSANPPPVAGSPTPAAPTANQAALQNRQQLQLVESQKPILLQSSNQPTEPPPAATEDMDSSAQPSTAARGLAAIGDVLATRQQKTQHYDEDRQVILGLLSDFRREFNDQATFKQSVSRCYNLLQRSDLEIGTFVSRMYEARAITKERSASITGVLAGGPSMSTKHKMAYWFSVLEDLCGIKPMDASQSSP